MVSIKQTKNIQEDINLFLISDEFLNTRTLFFFSIVHKSKMESLSPILTKLSYEIAVYSVLEDLLSIYKLKQDQDYHQLLLLIDIEFEDFIDSDDIEILLLSKLCEIEDEATLMSKVIEVINVLAATPDSVLRPYQQPFITSK